MDQVFCQVFWNKTVFISYSLLTHEWYANISLSMTVWHIFLKYSEYLTKMLLDFFLTNKIMWHNQTNITKIGLAIAYSQSKCGYQC